MFAEDNSKLISDLYNARNRRQVSDILEYMGESGNCVFVYPMLDGYKKHKYTSVGYYFIWNLSRLDYPDLGKRLNELLESYEIEKRHIPMTLFFMAERRFFSDIASKMAAMYLDHCTDPEFRSDFKLNALRMGCVLDYMNRAEILDGFEERLRGLVLGDGTSKAERAFILIQLFNINQERQIDFFAENYGRVCETGLEKNIAKQLIFCTTDKADKLKKMVLEGSNKEARKVLENYGKWSSNNRNADDAIVYDNMDAILKAGILREQINDKTSENSQFGFRIFPESELVPHQSQSVDDKEIFFGLCEDLHTLLVSVDPQVKNHGFSEKESDDILDRVFETDNDHDFANLFLFVNSRKIAIDDNFYGLRELDKALEDILIRSEDEAFYGSLRHMGIEDMYRDKQWHKIHGFFLNFYVQVLENMNKCFNQLVKQSLD